MKERNFVSYEGPLTLVELEKALKEKEKMMPEKDMINHPAHYTKGKIEVADFIADQELDFFEGNVVKYVCRWKHKDGLQDLKKAMWYLQYKINQMTTAKETPHHDLT